MQDKNKYIIREGWISIIANLLLFAIKYWVGIASGSIALIADAWHTLTDSVSSVIAIIGGKISQKPADDDHPFGHGRAEHISAMIIGVLLALVAFDFMISSIEKFGTHEKTIFGPLAWAVTIISIVVKEALAQYAFWAAKKTGSALLKADAWHHRTDALSSVVILVGLAVGKYFWWTDAVLGFIVAIMIAYASFEILSKEITSLLGESPSEELLLSIRETAQEECTTPLHLHHINVHDYGNHTEISCHIKLPPNMSLEEAHQICTKVENAIHTKFGYVSTIHPEPITWENPEF